jgi:quercetin dioxygenase-like cupin family protein
MKLLKLTEPAPASEPVQTLIEMTAPGKALLKVGSVHLKPGQRVPAEGLSEHTVDEVSLVLSGSLTGESGNDPFVISAGEISLIPAGEAHWARAGDAGVELLWIWFGKDTERSDN